MRETAKPGRRTMLSCGATASAGRGGEGSEGGDGGAEGGASLSYKFRQTSAAAGSVVALGLPGAMDATAVATARPSTQ
eukprot:3536252-Pleurochrysis_carterae.AAC.1